jgi:hypothetical protein
MAIKSACGRALGEDAERHQPGLPKANLPNREFSLSYLPCKKSAPGQQLLTVRDLLTIRFMEIAGELADLAAGRVGAGDAVISEASLLAEQVEIRRRLNGDSIERRK